MLPVYIISDVHLGCHEPDQLQGREQKLISFIHSLCGSASKLIINGDFFEFWMEYTHYINKHHFSVLFALKTLRESGTEIHYIAGNHDFNLGTFFKEHLDVIIHDDHYIFEYHNRKYYVTHGDGLSKNDWKYRILKRIIRHPISSILFKLLHPDLGMNLARFVGSTSRYAGKNPDTVVDTYKEAAFSILDKTGCDTFIQGHLHKYYHEKSGEKEFVCCEDWLFDTHFIKIDESGVSAISYKE
jgi:UDP-2,3-diacylglucosamine hydrolase